MDLTGELRVQEGRPRRASRQRGRATARLAEPDRQEPRPAEHDVRGRAAANAVATAGPGLSADPDSTCRSAGLHSGCCAGRHARNGSWHGPGRNGDADGNGNAGHVPAPAASSNVDDADASNEYAVPGGAVRASLVRAAVPTCGRCASAAAARLHSAAAPSAVELDTAPTADASRSLPTQYAPPASARFCAPAAATAATTIEQCSTNFWRATATAASASSTAVMIGLLILLVAHLFFIHLLSLHVLLTFTIHSILLNLLNDVYYWIN